MVQNGKKFCVLHSVCQEPYIILLSLMVHQCKMIISPGSLSFFQNFNFLGCQGGKMAKNGPKLQTILYVALHISGLENLENLGKQGFFFFFFLKLRENLESSGKKTEKSGTQGKLRELFCMMLKTFFWNFPTDQRSTAKSWIVTILLLVRLCS